MYYSQQRTKRRTGSHRGAVLLLCIAILFTSVQFGGRQLISKAADNDTVIVTVNYVYASNQAMVAQPYIAQIPKDSAFQKVIDVPTLFNYSIPDDLTQGLGNDIVLIKNETENKYSLKFDLDTVSSDVTVTLYYVSGTAKYTVYHYYQNLENDEYAEPTDHDIVELTGDIDAYTEAVANIMPGYHCNGIPQTTVAADGSTKVEIYYDRDYYTVIFDVNGGINGPEPIYAKYGTTFNIDDIPAPTRKGYTFIGWGNPAASGMLTVTENKTYTAVWQPENGQADYTIVLWGQNANDEEYSYLSSHDAWGNVGNRITWNEDTLISHVHTEECLELICRQEEHTHTDECLICGKAVHTHSEECCSMEEHTHSVTCYPGATDITASPSIPPSNPDNGQIFKGSILFFSWSYIYINGQWYEYSGSETNGNVVKTDCGKSEHTHGTECNHDNCTLEEHTHDDFCCGCGKTEHIHTDSCFACSVPDTPARHMSDIQPNETLWVYDHSDTVTVDANGSTVMNVYFTRAEFTLEFRMKDSAIDDFGSITARWGKNISNEYNAITNLAGSSFWSENSDASGPWTNYIGVMPQRNIVYYCNITEGNETSTMTYYGEDLNGNYQMIFTISFKGSGYTVTEEDRYEFEGFTFDHGTDIGEKCNGAKFYYKRNSYNLEFYSASNNLTDHYVAVKFRDSLGQYYYTPKNKPDFLEPDAVFVGWYLNPECTGEKFDMAAHTMPSNNIALYAKWVNGLYSVRTYTDDSMKTPYTYEGYNGEQTDIEKYTLATEPTSPVKDGYVFVGWFYKDGETEKLFSYTMPITRDYDLYPKFSEPTAVSYIVHYYKSETTEKVADDRINSVKIGTTVTEKAKMGTELNMLIPDMQNKYYPTNTSTSAIITQPGQEIIFYYTEASSVSYTVYYQDASGNNLLDPVTKTTEYSTVTEQYVPIGNYAPRQFSITQDMSSDASQNKIVFIYNPTLSSLTIQKSGWDSADENQTFLFRITGSDENTKDTDLTVTVHENGQTTVTDMTIGSYTVTELTDWSWRYSPYESASRNVQLDSDGETLTFANTRTEDKWLDGDSCKVNHFISNY